AGDGLPPDAGVQGKGPVRADGPARQLRRVGEGLELDVIPGQVLDAPLALAHHLPLDRVDFRQAVAAPGQAEEGREQHETWAAGHRSTSGATRGAGVMVTRPGRSGAGASEPVPM